MTKIIDISTNLFNNELGQPTNISVPALCTYFRYNVGNLNNLLGTNFNLNNYQGTPNYLEIIVGQDNTTLIDDEAAAIYKYVYLVSYYQRMITAFTGVGDINLLIQATSDQGTLRFTDRANLAKLYLQLRKDVESTLNRLVNKYKFANKESLQITGDDLFVKPNNIYSIGDEGGILFNQDII